MKVTLVRTHDESANIKTFFFEPEKPLAYTAGQFIELTVPHDNPDNRGQRRWFTLSSSPTEELLAVTTKFAAESSSFKVALRNLHPGDTVTMSDPMGDFVLPKFVQVPLVFIAGGIGITPYRSMLQWLADTREERPIKLLYAVPDEDSIVFNEVFERANQHATIVVSKPSPAWGGERGHLNADMVLGIEELSSDALYYLSGPEPMMQELVAQLKEKGLDKHQIVTDLFPNYPKD